MNFRGIAGPIVSNQKLADALGLDLVYLTEISVQPAEIRYRRLTAHIKSDGSERIVYSPNKDVRRIQRAIANRFFKDPAVVHWPEFIYGGIANKSLEPASSPRDYVACARRHCGARSLLKLDIREFFDNITVDVVEDVFFGLLRWAKEPARLAANLCTMNGVVPQGGITSSHISLLCLYREEPKVAALLQKKQFVYTRYVDDITVSSRKSNQEYEYARALIERMLLNRGFTVNSRKVHIQKSGTEALEVHGLRVGFPVPRLPQRELKRIRLVCRQTEFAAKEDGVRGYAYRRRFHRAVGLVNKLARVGNNQHGKLISRLMNVRPLPSHSDYKLATDIAYELRDVYSERRATFWYGRRFYILMERLNLIAAENEGWAKNLRNYMRHFSPVRDEG